MDFAVGDGDWDGDDDASAEYRWLTLLGLFSRGNAVCAYDGTLEGRCG